MKELGSFEVSAVAVIVVQKRLQVSRNTTIMCVYVKEMTSTFTLKESKSMCQCQLFGNELMNHIDYKCE